MRIRRFQLGWLAVAAVSLAGLAIRIWASASAVAAPDSDEAIVGLMARHLLHGEITTFYWGQPYGGTLEVFLVAPIFAIFGSSLGALRVVPIGLVAVACLIVWRAGLRLGSRRYAITAACVLWLWPPYAIAHTTREYGFYASNLVFCAALVLLALRVVEEPSRLRVGVFGLVLGVAFWETAQIIPVALPLVAWIVWKATAAIRHVWIGIAAAVLGATPWIVWNVKNDFGSLLTRSDLRSYAHGLRLLASPLVPMLLGLRAPLSAEPILPALLMYAAYAGLIVLFLYGAWRSRDRPESILYFTVLGFVLIWPISHRVTLLTSHPVYLVVIAPVLALIVARAATTELRSVAVVLVAGLVTLVTLHRMDVWARTDPDHWPPDTPRSLAPLAAALDRIGVRYAYANYWIAYRLSFDTGERIIATQYPYTELTQDRHGRLIPAPNPPARYTPWQREVGEHEHAFIVFRNESVPRRVLASHGYVRQIVGPFAVYARR